MKVGELKKILEKFDDKHDVFIYFDIVSETAEEGHYYRIENWTDNDGYLSLWISDNVINLEEDIKIVKEYDVEHDKVGDSDFNFV